MARTNQRQGATSPAASLADLPALPLAELREQWRLHFRSDAPARLSREILVQAIAYHLQEKEHGGLSRAARLQLAGDGRNSKAEGGSTISAVATKPARARVRRTVKAGTRFFREWQGRTYEVLTSADGSYSHAGITYRSLSEVARAITGTRWSGPAFFGLTGPKGSGHG